MFEEAARGLYLYYEPEYDECRRRGQEHHALMYHYSKIKPAGKALADGCGGDDHGLREDYGEDTDYDTAYKSQQGGGAQLFLRESTFAPVQSTDDDGGYGEAVREAHYENADLVELECGKG